MRSNDNVFPLDMLPIDILLQIFSRLSLENFASMQLINSKLRISAKHNQLWRPRFRQHFPHALHKLDVNNILNWYEQFSTTCQNEYPDEKSRKLISMVKDNRFQELKEILQFDDLIIADKNGISLSQWIGETKNQPLLDYCYHLSKEFAKANFNDANQAKLMILIYAVCFNQLDSIHDLVTQVVNVHAHDAYIFNQAIGHKHIDVIHALLKLGFDPNIAEDVNRSILIGNNHTPLHLAVCNHDLDITIALISHGVNVNAATTPWNETPLLMAALNGDIEIVNALIASGANTDINHLLGMSPLSAAKLFGYTEIALAIVKQQLRNYLIKSDQRNDDDYETYSILGNEFNLSLFGACSAKQKKEAGKALARVYLDGENESLDAHQKALNHGELGSLYDDLKNLTAAIAKKMNTKRYG